MLPLHQFFKFLLSYLCKFIVFCHAFSLLIASRMIFSSIPYVFFPIITAGGSCFLLYLFFFIFFFFPFFFFFFFLGVDVFGWLFFWGETPVPHAHSMRS